MEDKANDIDISSAKKLFNEPFGESAFINYSDERFRFRDSKVDVYFKDVTSFTFKEIVLIDKAEKYAIITFFVIGTLLGAYNASNATWGEEALEFFATFFISGGIWGGLVYAITKYLQNSKKIIQDENMIFEVASPNKKFKMQVTKQDGDRLSKLFQHAGISIYSSKELVSEGQVEPVQSKVSSTLSSEKYDELVRLKSLLDLKIISEDEFKSMKEDLLGKK
ncbi:MAG: hypothetical protein CVU96_02640 [Firmicutes bacterium HGW-Firmicutes-20]|jgi:hypothetical protein|nr:MAG: hypothetical protein CVU96_02640 [Firmicutes bacterium HGW-Firmicutes-20]PKM66421.1 MAG: hypothetical protein CVU94_07480 [Firmicutes bacterium HGW-Firmicutes-19]